MTRLNPPTRDHRRLRSFTLIELAVVVAIIAIWAAIAVPRFANTLMYHRADAAAGRVARDLGLAREHARTTSASQAVAFKVGGGAYALVGMRHLDHATREYQVLLSDAPYEAQIISANLGGDDQIIFDGYGVPDSGGSIVIQVGPHSRQIDVDPNTGEAQVR